MKRKELEEINEMLDRLIDKLDLRKDFEEFERDMMEGFKPKFEIGMKSIKKGEAQFTCIGSHKDTIFGLSQLIAAIADQTNLSEKDIRFAVDSGLGCVEDDEED